MRACVRPLSPNLCSYSTMAAWFDLLQVVSAIVAVLCMGWILAIVFFGRYHTGFVTVGVTDA